MNLKLTSIALALAFAFAGAAQAQTQGKSDRKAASAEKEQIEAAYKADKAKCDGMKGNAKDICMAEAKGKRKVARAELEAKKQQASNRLIAVKREADKYWIEQKADGDAERDEKVTRAKANEVAYQKSAEGLAAEIKAVGASGPDVLNREIATHVFPQLEHLKAAPYARSQTPIDIRYLQGGGGQ